MKYLAFIGTEGAMPEEAVAVMNRGFPAYLTVRDAAALYEEWSRPGLAGHTHPAEPTPWGMLEGSHTDPDGNMIRFGSPIKELADAVAAGPARRSRRGSGGDPGGLRRREHRHPRGRAGRAEPPTRRVRGVAGDVRRHNCAGGGTRTPTVLPPTGPKPAAYSNSATPARA